MMNEYEILKNRQQDEFDKFPIAFAFSDEQFEEGMKKLGLEPTDTDKIYQLLGGGFYRKEDSDRFYEMMERFDREFDEAVAADETGDGFVFQMFYTELSNHEYGITHDVSETLDALDYTVEDVINDKKLAHGLEKALECFRADHKE